MEKGNDVPARASEGNAPLPVVQTVKQTYALVLVNFGGFMRLAWLWVFVVAFSTKLIGGFFWPSHQAALEDGALVSWVQVMTSAVSLTASASVAVAWHRYVLLGIPLPGPRYLALDRCVLIYLGLVLAVSAPFYIVILRSGRLDGAASGLAAATALAAGVYLAIRLAVYLPAVALKSNVTLAAVWRATRGQWWRLLAGTAASVLPAIAVSALVSLPELMRDAPGDELEAAGQTHLGFVMSSVASEAATVLCSVFAISFLSLAFRHYFPNASAGPPQKE